MIRPRHSFARWLWLSVGGLGWLAAQDVSVSPLQWKDSRDAPEALPVVKSRLQTKFPAELRATPDIGYIVYEVTHLASGKNVELHPHPTLAAWLAAERTALQEWSFAPARREGKPVNSVFTFSVIFNPASAPASGPEATPRLLEPSLVKLRRPPGTPATAVIPERNDFAEIRVDPQGNVAEVLAAPAEFKAQVAVAMKNWRFAPARHEGQPVAAQIRVPIILSTEGGHPHGKVTQPPRVIVQERPIYPFVMRAANLRGEVLVDFTVDIEGRVRNAFVVRTLNPSFDDPALEAVRKWRFEPGRAGDRVVPVHMQVPVVFTLGGGGNDGMEMTRKPDMSKLPEELRYDTPPKIMGAVRPVYPYAALQADKDGRAVVRYFILENGRVAGAEVAEASAPEFGQALLTAVEQFEYQPAVKAGRPSKAVMSFTQEFERDEGHQLVAPEDLDLLRRERKRPETIVTLRDLDEPLKPLSRRPPKMPQSLPAGVENGEALVEVLVDEDGRVRLPRAVSASHGAFGYAAVQGVAAWRFEPPMRGGRGVVVRAQIPVKFNQPKAKK